MSSHLLDKSSCECLKSELDLFGIQSTQTAVEQTRYLEYYPIAQTSHNSPLEYHVISSDDEYLDLSQSYLRMRQSIRKLSGEDLTEPANDDVEKDTTHCYVLPINYFASTQFKNVEVILGGVQISPSDVQYSYRSYFETLLSYGASKREQLHTALFYKDQIDPDMRSHNVRLPNCQNSGAHKRFEATKYSRIFETTTRIHNGLFNQSKLLLSNVDLRIKFHRADVKFSLMAKFENQDYRIDIDSAVLMVAHKKIAPSVREAHELALMKTPAKYNITHSDIKFYTKPMGSADLSEPNIVTGVLPRKVAVALTSSAGFGGSLARNPLNFAHYNLQTIQLRRNGVPIPYEQIEVDFRHGLVSQGYLSLFQGMGHLFQDDTIDISMRDYVESGFAIYLFNLNQDGSNDTMSLLQEGVLSLHIKLAQSLTESVTVVVYLERDGLLEIDHERNVKVE